MRAHCGCTRLSWGLLRETKWQSRCGRGIVSHGLQYLNRKGTVSTVQLFLPFPSCAKVHASGGIYKRLHKTYLFGTRHEQVPMRGSALWRGCPRAAASARLFHRSPITDFLRGAPNQGHDGHTYAVLNSHEIRRRFRRFIGDRRGHDGGAVRVSARAGAWGAATRGIPSRTPMPRGANVETGRIGPGTRP